MAKSRRRMSKTPRGPRADWVYRPHIRDEAGGLFETFGTYESTEVTQGVGIPNLTQHILYDSHAYRGAEYPDQIAANTPGLMLAASARAEGAKPMIHRVQGSIWVRPSSWALGSVLWVAWRFGIFEQDPATGSVLLDSTYTILNTSANTVTGMAQWANAQPWNHERVFRSAFGEAVSFIKELRFNFPVRRRLRAHECYAVLSEGHATLSVNTLMSYRLRTLVSDDT